MCGTDAVIVEDGDVLAAASNKWDEQVRERSLSSLVRFPQQKQVCFSSYFSAVIVISLILSSPGPIEIYSQGRNVFSTTKEENLLFWGVL